MERGDGLPIVTTSELSRGPGRVLERIARGERLVVCRNNIPLATLQPLDGFVLQPMTGHAHDIYGWPVGGIAEEAAKLTPAQQALLTDGVRQARLKSSIPSRAGEFDSGELFTAIDELRVLGFAYKTHVGSELTGRGWAMREHLLRADGRLGPKDSLFGFAKPDW